MKGGEEEEGREEKNGWVGVKGKTKKIEGTSI